MGEDLIAYRQRKLAEYKAEESAGTLGVAQAKPIILPEKKVIFLKNGEVSDLVTLSNGEKLWRPAAESLDRMLKALTKAGYGYDLSDAYRPIGNKGDGEFYANKILKESTQWGTFEAYKTALEVFLKGEKDPSYKSDPFYKKYISYVNKGAAKPGTSPHGLGLAIDIFTKNHGTTVGTVASGAYLKKDINGKIIEPREALQDKTQIWITNNGKNYGWIWTGKDFKNNPEAWHFEYNLEEDSFLSKDTLLALQTNPSKENDETVIQQAGIFDFKNATNIMNKICTKFPTK